MQDLKCTQILTRHGMCVYHLAYRGNIIMIYQKYDWQIVPNRAGWVIMNVILIKLKFFTVHKFMDHIHIRGCGVHFSRTLKLLCCYAVNDFFLRVDLMFLMFEKSEGKKSVCNVSANCMIVIQ